MRGRAVTRVLPAALLLAPLVLASCTPPQACTEIGASNGVGVIVGKEVVAPTWKAQVCLGDHCALSETVVGEEFAAGGMDQTFVELEAIDSTEPVRIEARLLDGDGATLRGPVTVTVTPVVVQPNGPECPPTAYQAEVDLSQG